MQNRTAPARPHRDGLRGRHHSAGAAGRPVATRAGAVIMLASLAVIAAACSSSAPPAASSSPGPATTPSATAVSQPTASPGTATAPATASPSPSPAAVPTLGQLAGDFAHGQGFGQVKPAKIFNGGDPTGLVTDVAWSSWGGAQASGTGTAEYVGPNQSVAQGTEEPATVVAFHLGFCDGKYMYQAVEWYFPQHKQAFNPNTYENICTGGYVGGP